MVGNVGVGGSNPIRIQSMLTSDTRDTDACVKEALELAEAGCEIIRLTAQTKAYAANLENIARELRAAGCHVPLVADIHFKPDAAMEAAKWVEKIRINPGNFVDKKKFEVREYSDAEYREELDRLREEFTPLVLFCREHGRAMRIGSNHGSLSDRILNRFGDTPEGMVESAIEFAQIARDLDYHSLVFSMKASNVKVMVAAYRLLVERMNALGPDWNYPIHLGVTEAGGGEDGRIKSAVGIGALMADGIGDTIRVSLTEAPENEIPVAELLVKHFARRPGKFPVLHPERYSPTEYRRRTNVAVPVVHTEPLEGFCVIEAVSENPTAELRAAILNLDTPRPVVVKRRYGETSPETLAVKAAADLGVLFLDGLADGIWIDAPGFAEEEIRNIELMILQAARVRMSRTEYIACPSCGRTLYDIEGTLTAIRARTSHLKNLKIGVMGCIVNGPGEMADADYGYVGAAPGRITLYKGRTVVEKNIPQEEALDRLVALIKANGDWADPENQPERP